MFPVAWDEVLVNGQPVDTSPVDGPWAFEGSSYVDVTLQENPQLEPFSGYWIRNSSEPPQDIVLHIPPQEARFGISAAQAAEVAVGHEILWQVEITAACAGVQDGANRAGVSAIASDSWAALERHEPPAAPERSVSLDFPHASWIEQAGSDTADDRAASTDADGYTRPFDVVKNFRDEASGNVVELEFAG